MNTKTYQHLLSDITKTLEQARTVLDLLIKKSETDYEKDTGKKAEVFAFRKKHGAKTEAQSPANESVARRLFNAIQRFDAGR